MNTIAYFQQEQCRDTTTMAQMQHYSKAIFALQKREPQLVNHEKTFWKYYHYCPSCGNQLDMEGLHYCNRCGQCLDWSNYHEELRNAKRTYHRAKKRTD